MKKKTALVLFISCILAAALCFAGCGDSGKPEESGQSGEPSSETPSVEWDPNDETGTMVKLFDDFPVPEGKDIIAGGTSAAGYLTYSKTFTGVTDKDLSDYFVTLQDSGFKQVRQTEISALKKLYTYQDNAATREYSMYFTSATSQLYIEASACIFSYPWTAKDAFKDVPLPQAASDPREVGSGEYISETTCKDYAQFQKNCDDMTAAGFTKFSETVVDNDKVYAAVFTKDNQEVVLSFSALKKTIWYQAVLNKVPSDRLLENASYTEGFIPGLKNTFTMMPVHSANGALQSGNCFFMQLKNGHFIVFDGGTQYDGDQLVKEMISRTPEGQKTIVEGWFYTHMHGDHAGQMQTLTATTFAAKKKDYANKLIINGVYYQENTVGVLGFEGGVRGNQGAIQYALPNIFKTESGEATPIYRVHTGEVYHFGDITIDVVMTYSLISPTKWTTDNNNTSTGYVVNVDGNRLMNLGDMEAQGLDILIAMHDANYFNVDVLGAVHHGINFPDNFRSLIRTNILLYSAPNDQWLVDLAAKHNGGVWITRFAEVKSKSKEVHCYEEGIYTIEFPIAP